MFKQQTAIHSYSMDCVLQKSTGNWLLKLLQIWWFPRNSLRHNSRSHPSQLGIPPEKRAMTNRSMVDIHSGFFGHVWKFLHL
jgi:hypothetical protein